MLNEPILQAWKDTGVPPVLLKQLIRTKASSGHLSMTQSTLALVISPISAYKMYLTGIAVFTPSSAQLRQVQTALQKKASAYQILSSLVTICPTCENGIDPVAASRSVDVLAQALLGYCYQTEQLIYNATGWNPSLAVDYATIWKLTLMNYNSGPQCIYDAIAEAFEETEGPIRWPDIVANTKGDQCLRGMYYAKTITTKYFDFPPST